MLRRAFRRIECLNVFHSGFLRSRLRSPKLPDTGHPRYDKPEQCRSDIRDHSRESGALDLPVFAQTRKPKPIALPRLYSIVDPSLLPGAADLLGFVAELVSAGCTLLQYRNKTGKARMMVEQARTLRQRLGASATLIMNDRADLCLAAEFDGVHVGRDDLSPGSVRRIIGGDRWLGVSTHTPEQLQDADLTSADYLAIGPVFDTSSKLNPDPVVGLEGVRGARALTRKPLVAIGGITRANAASVIEAGADSVAVISDLLRDPGKSAEEFFRILR
jgi:thiamine-phosphate pyrophosphorylase